MFDSIALHVEQELSTNKLIEDLIRFGFVRQEGITEPGDFSIKGGAIDIFLVDFQDPVRLEFFTNTIEKMYTFDISSGRKVADHQNLIILPIKGISPRKIKKNLDGTTEVFPIDNFVDIEPGDFVVHTEYGIGKYLGTKRVNINNKIQDSLVIEYANDDKLYVPFSDLHYVQKYIGFEGKPPVLYKLGSKKWKQVKAKTTQGIMTLAREMLDIQARRVFLEGYSFSKDTAWQKDLEESFPYQDTEDQVKATIDVKNDMQQPKPMDRLLCGDVGYGKTEIALRAAFKAVMDNKQVAILVPTTILAEQHFKTFSERLKKFPVVVKMLSRFRTQMEQDIIVKELESGNCDIVIGTHRLLSSDIKFSNLGLVVIDEEQRFGVKHKEKFKHLRLMVDVLTLTATPIPRTLYLSMMGAKDISIVNTPPVGRLPVETYVGAYDLEIIKKAISYELSRNGQVYFVHNRVNNITSIALKLRHLFPNVNIAVGHGQMSSKELEKIMIDFINGKIQILVCTTIIESGIDIPNANTIIVNDADIFGLADLYQLRGRVGRFKNRAHAYFLYSKDKAIAEQSYKRLNAIEKFTQLGSGFKIAMEDLQIRGAGNILGAEQHGFICAVGFDLYCRLLKDSIEISRAQNNKPYE